MDRVFTKKYRFHLNSGLAYLSVNTLKHALHWRQSWANFRCIGVSVAAAAAFSGPCLADPNLRPYLDLRYGKSLYTSSESGPFDLDSPSEEPSLGFSIGADIGRHWGAELVLDYVKTNLLDRSSARKLGDYSTAVALFQLRWRNALWRDRLVGYAVLGGGATLGEFSGREDFNFFGGGDDLVATGIAGVGLDYFLTSNLALTVEAKYHFGGDPSLRDGRGGSKAIDSGDVNLTGGLRVYLDHWGAGPARLSSDARPPDDSRVPRGYFVARAGQGFFTGDHRANDLEVESHSGVLGAAGFGVNLSRHWGAEYVMEYARAQLHATGMGDISGYPIATGLLLARWRYPLADGRSVPYVVFGPGFGFAQEGDLDKPRTISGFNADSEWSAVAAVGIGFDYYVEQNVAIGFEVRNTTLFDVDMDFGGRRRSLTMDYVSVSGGLRVFFP